MNEIYTLQEVAKILKVTVPFVTKLVKSGKLKSFLLGRSYRVREESLDEFSRGIYGDTPVTQTRKVNPSEATNRPRGRKPKQVSAEVSKEIPCPQVGTDAPTAEQPEQELGINLFGEVDTLPTDAEPIELILKLKADGMTYPAIAEHLNGLSIKTVKGCAWTKATVENNVRLHKNNKANVSK